MPDGTCRASASHDLNGGPLVTSCVWQVLMEVGMLRKGCLSESIMQLIGRTKTAYRTGVMVREMLLGILHTKRRCIVDPRNLCKSDNHPSTDIEASHAAYVHGSQAGASNNGFSDILYTVGRG